MSWITVCGGGNGAHALVGTLLLRDRTTHIRLYLPLEDEQRRFTEALASHSSFQVRVAGEVHSIASDRIHVTENPEEAARSSIIMMVVLRLPMGQSFHNWRRIYRRAALLLPCQPVAAWSTRHKTYLEQSAKMAVS